MLGKTWGVRLEEDKPIITTPTSSSNATVMKSLWIQRYHPCLLAICQTTGKDLRELHWGTSQLLGITRRSAAFEINDSKPRGEEMYPSDSGAITTDWRHALWPRKLGANEMAQWLKVLAVQTWWSELDHWNLRKGRRANSIKFSCQLHMFIMAPPHRTDRHTERQTDTHMHTQIKWNETQFNLKIENIGSFSAFLAPSISLTILKNNVLYNLTLLTSEGRISQCP